MARTVEAAIDAYVEFFETLKPESLRRLEELCTPGVRFSDPFNQIEGVEGFRRVLARMFTDVADPRFLVTDRAFSGRTCYLRWTFSFRPKRSSGQPMTIDGVSELHVRDDGKISAHLDHWDSGAAVYARIPVLGSLIRMVRRRLSAEPSTRPR